LWKQTTSDTDSLPPSSNTLPRAETLATIASIQSRTKAKNKPKKLPRVSSTPVTESDKFLNENIYIGPARKKGRPKVQTNGESKVKPEDLGIVTSRPPASLPTSTRIGKPTAAAIQPNSNINLAAVQPHSLDLAALAALLSSSQNEATRNTLLLQALNCIDTSNPQEAKGSVNPVLVDALHQLFSNVFSQAQPVNAATLVTSSTPPLTTPNTKGVLLDKENVNPIASSRQSEGEYQHVRAIGDAILPSDRNL